MFSICSISAQFPAPTPTAPPRLQRWSTATVVRPSSPPCERQAQSWVLGNLRGWGMLSVRSAEMAAKAALVSADIRRPRRQQLCIEPARASRLLCLQKE